MLSSGIRAKDIWGPKVINGREGETLTLCCGYDEEFKSYEKYWCRGESFESCTIVLTSHDKKKGRTSLLDNKIRRKLCITVKYPIVADSGPYWCAIKRWVTDEHFPVIISIDPGKRWLIHLWYWWIVYFKRAYLYSSWQTLAIATSLQAHQRLALAPDFQSTTIEFISLMS